MLRLPHNSQSFLEHGRQRPSPSLTPIEQRRLKGINAGVEELLRHVPAMLHPCACADAGEGGLFCAGGTAHVA